MFVMDMLFVFLDIWKQNNVELENYTGTEMIKENTT